MPSAREEKRTKMLGMSSGCAQHRLRKSLMFSMAKKLNITKCFRCNKEIECEVDFSIDHKIGWESKENSVELFFDIENIAFSHLSCNIGAAEKKNKKYSSRAESYRDYYSRSKLDGRFERDRERRKRWRKNRLAARSGNIVCGTMEDGAEPSVSANYRSIA